jgi:hypothetical protein
MTKPTIKVIIALNVIGALLLPLLVELNKFTRLEATYLFFVFMITILFLLKKVLL